MELLDLARYARLCAVGGDLGLRHGTGALPPGNGPGGLPTLPLPRSDMVPPVLPDSTWIRGVREYLAVWKAVLAKRLSTNTGPNPEIQRERETILRELAWLGAGLETFQQDQQDVQATRAASVKARKVLSEAQDAAARALADQEARIAEAARLVEATRRLSAQSFLQPELATPAIKELQQRLAESSAQVRDIESDLMLLKKPLLFGRGAYNRDLATLHARQADAESECVAATESLAQACQQAQAARIQALEEAARQEQTRVEPLRQPASVKSAQAALDAAMAAEQEALVRAATQFEILKAKEPALRAQHSKVEADCKAAEEAALAERQAVDRLRVLLALVYAGLVSGAVAAIRDQIEDGGDTDHLTKVMVQSGLVDLLADSEFEDLRGMWLDKCPTLMDECYLVFGDLALAFLKTQNLPKTEIARMVGPLLGLVGRSGFIAQAAQSAAFFKAVSDLFATEVFRTKQDRFLMLLVAALYGGEEWSRTHRPELSGRLEALAFQLVQGLTGKSPRSDAGLRRLFTEAQNHGRKCLADGGSLG